VQAERLTELRGDMLAVAMRDLRYSLPAIERALDRRDHHQALGRSLYDAEVAAVRDVHDEMTDRELMLGGARRPSA
jgi:hypothetical protein